MEDGSLEPSKPLVEVLREAAEAKEAAFQAVWKSMKVGKICPAQESKYLLLLCHKELSTIPCF